MYSYSGVSVLWRVVLLLELWFFNLHKGCWAPIELSALLWLNQCLYLPLNTILSHLFLESYFFSIKWRSMTSTMGRFKNVGLVWRRKRIVMSQRPCGGALKGSREISSTQPWPRKCSEMEIPVGGVIMPHAAHSWSLLWAAPWADKSLSTWGPRVVCTLGCQSPRERSPSVGHQG